VYGRFVTVQLREAQLDDRDRLKRLLADYLFEFDGRTESYPYLDAYWEEPERLPLLIETDGDLVGLCLIRRRGDGWSIAEFSVIPSQRGRGIGGGAVEALAARAGSEGAAFLEAKVHPDNHEALPFWLALGFSEVEGPGTGVTVTRRSL
jgi:GNAT superfamily N-acetyltransferase